MTNCGEELKRLHISSYITGNPSRFWSFHKVSNLNDNFGLFRLELDG